MEALEERLARRELQEKGIAEVRRLAEAEPRGKTSVTSEANQDTCRPSPD